MVKDLTVGKPSKVLIRFSVPMILATVFQQLYNLADSIIAGNVLGVDALSATSVSYPVTLIYVAIALGGANGAAVVIANLMGRKHYVNMKTCIATAFTSMAVISALLTVIGELLSDEILVLLNTEAAIFNDSNDYLKIYTYGVTFVMLYNAATAAFTAMGDSRTPLVLLIFSSVFNIVLDLVFTVEGCRLQLGVAGLAWATFTAQGIACVAAIVWLIFKLKKTVRNLSDDPSENSENPADDEPDSDKIKIFSSKQFVSVCRIAGPSILQQLFVPLGLMFVQSIINGFSSPVIAGYTAAVKVNTMCIACSSMMSNAVSSFTAQNMGAGKMERVTHGLKSALAIACIMAGAFTVLSLTCSRYLVGLFASSKDAQFEDMVAAGKQFLIITSPFYVVVAVKLVIDGLHRGAGRMMFFTIGTATDLVIRVAFSFILSPYMGFLGICWSYPIGWILGIAATLSCFFTKKWKVYKRI